MATGKRRITINDVARRAGVSRSLVSIVLNRNSLFPRVADATVKRIESAMRDLHYAPDASARTLRLAKAKVVGFVINQLHPEVPYQCVLYNEVSDFFHRHGYDVYVHMVHGENVDAETVFAAIRAQRAAGVVATPIGGNPSIRIFLHEIFQGIPMRIIGDFTARPKDDRIVRFPQQEALTAALERLDASGTVARCIFWHHPGAASAEALLMAAHAYAHRAQAMTMLTVCSSWGDFAPLLQALSRGQSGYTAVVALGIPRGVRLVSKLIRDGWRVPEEIAVLGMGLVDSFHDYCLPALTTVHYDTRGILEHAMTGLLHEVDTGTPARMPPRDVRSFCRISARGTTPDGF